MTRWVPYRVVMPCVCFSLSRLLGVCLQCLRVLGDYGVCFWHHLLCGWL